MINVNVELGDALAYGLAVARGWTPTVDDTSQPLDGDNYPQIPNPVSMPAYLSGVISAYVAEYVLNQGRKNVVTEFQSIFNTVEDQVKTGAFDALILSGNVDGIKQAVLASLVPQ